LYQYQVIKSRNGEYRDRVRQMGFIDALSVQNEYKVFYSYYTVNISGFKAWNILWAEYQWLEVILAHENIHMTMLQMTPL